MTLVDFPFLGFPELVCTRVFETVRCMTFTTLKGLYELYKPFRVEKVRKPPTREVEKGSTISANALTR